MIDKRNKKLALAFALYLLNRCPYLYRVLDDVEHRRHIKALLDLYILAPRHCTEVAEECEEELAAEGKSVGEVGNRIARRVQQMRRKKGGATK